MGSLDKFLRQASWTISLDGFLEEGPDPNDDVKGNQVEHSQPVEVIVAVDVDPWIPEHLEQSLEQFHGIGINTNSTI